MRIKVVADDKIPFLRGVLEECAEVRYLPGGKTGTADVRDADALITRTRTKCSPGLLDGSKVSFIATATIGFDHIDTDYCDRRGIYWTSAPGCNSGSVMQYVVSALLNLAWRHGKGLNGSTLGVVGAGNVGSKVIAAAGALGMRVLCCDPPRARREGGDGFVSLDHLVSESDFITLHVPLNMDGDDCTYKLVDDDFLARMKPGAFLINSSRGEVVDGMVLKSALRSGHLGGAVLDVWENEPEIDLELLSMLDYGTPHIAGYSSDGKANGTTMSVRALSRHFKLGMDDWSVTEVPPPDAPVICLADNEADTQERLRYAVNHCYDIARDDGALRKDVKSFERLRGDYPLRREFFAYEVRGCRDGESAIFAGLGFRI